MCKVLWIIFLHLCVPAAWGDEQASPSADISNARGITLNVAPPRFTIAEFNIEGNTLIDSKTLAAAVQPMLGKERDFANIQQAVTAIYGVYEQAGYQTVRVIIPEQAIQSGTIRLKIVESKLVSLEVKGNLAFDEANIRNSLVDARIGEVPNSKKIGENLRLANETYAKQTKVTFRATDKADEVKGTARVVDKNPVLLTAVLDNTGTPSTGISRLGLIYRHSNVLNRDHQLTALYQTSPEHPGNVTVLDAQYRIPLYRMGSILELDALYSNVDSGVINTGAGNYFVAGSGTDYGFHFIKLLPRIGNWDQRINLGIDYRRIDNKVKLAGTSTLLLPDIDLHPWSLAYEGFINKATGEWTASAGYSRNMPAGDMGNAAAFALSGQRAGANPNYSIWRYSLNYNGQLYRDWLLHMKFNGQQSRDALVNAEQFGVGGMESVRGFDERELSNDRGNFLSLEVQTPNLTRIGESSIFSIIRLALFYDAAQLKRNLPLPGEDVTSRVSSVGIGLRLGLGKYTAFNLDFADVIKGGGVRRDGSKMLHARLSYQK